jgi:probable phosphomutase (TIGR03848 family)/uncharacterized repeat protein (TIGR03847 family)
MTVMILVRHATNDYVKEGRLAGWTPGVHINAQGQREAEALARRLASVPIEAIYSSPLERAMDTAQIVAACHHLPIEVRHGLGESQAGEWTGRYIRDLQETETWKAIQKSPVGVKLPGGESIDEVQTRIATEVENIRRAHPNGIVVVVSHADPLKALIAHYLCWDLNQFQRIIINPASASILWVDDHVARLVLLNHTGELPKIEKSRPPEKEAQSKGAAEAAGATGAPNASQTESRKDEKKMTEANLLYDLNPVSRVMAGALGEPGHRVFYLQARQGTLLITLQAEKEQIASLNSGIVEMLDKLPERVQAESQASPYDAVLEEPLEPLFRIGQLGLGYDQENDLLVIVAYEVTEEENPETVNVVRFWATRGQMRVLAEHASQVVAGGRPICVLCGRPIDPEGHFCPRRNGHGAKATLT